MQIVLPIIPTVPPPSKYRDERLFLALKARSLGYNCTEGSSIADLSNACHVVILHHFEAECSQFGLRQFCAEIRKYLPGKELQQSGPCSGPLVRALHEPFDMESLSLCGGWDRIARAVCDTSLAMECPTGVNSDDNIECPKR